MSGPLAGIRVIDLTAIVVGPICTRVLADQGAEVIKVEAPEGDLLRRLAHGARHPGMSGKFMQFNRNKRSLALDIKHPEGRAALLGLIETADVFVSNIRPLALERAGLGWDALRARNPRLIHCSILAFGRGGPYFNRPAYDPIIQSLSGVAGTFERAGGPPRFVPMVMTDHITGLIAAQCIGFALFRRERSGVGEAIEVPMFENMASFVMSEHLGPGTFDPPLGPLGDGRLLSPDYRPVATADGYITVGPNTDAQATAFFAAIGRPELASDPRFRDAASRTAHAADYLEIRAAAMRGKTTAAWLTILNDCDVPAAAYNTLESLLEDPHLAATGFFAAEEHPSEGRIRRTATPNRFSGGMREDPLPAPRLGEQSRAILREAGIDDAAIDRLAAAGVVVMPGGPPDDG